MDSSSYDWCWLLQHGIQDEGSGTVGAFPPIEASVPRGGSRVTDGVQIVLVAHMTQQRQQARAKMEVSRRTAMSPAWIAASKTPEVASDEAYGPVSLQ